MDRPVPPRITYWTGTWDPAREAISKEVALLRAALSPAGPVVAFSPGNRSSVQPGARVITLSARRWLTLRLLAAPLERTGDVNHVFGTLAAWHWVKALRRRPIVLTVVSEADALALEAYTNVRLFVAENSRLRDAIVRAGIPSDRIRVIHPGVNLSRFQVAPPPETGPFRILFASWPEEPAELEGRGVFTLVDIARRCPDVQVILLRRRWGKHEETTATLEAVGLPPNVCIEDLGSRTMTEVFAGVHASAALFASGYGKSTPNSLVESLACGRPVLVSPTIGISDTVCRAGAGVSVESADAVIAAVATLRDRWCDASNQARALAETTFSEDAFVSGYLAVYCAMAEGRPMSNTSAEHKFRLSCSRRLQD